MSKCLYRSGIRAFGLMSCLLLASTAVYAQTPVRPNVGKELYIPPWGDDVTKLATTCENLQKDECGLLRQLMRTPRAYWLGISFSRDQEVLDLHNVLRDAIHDMAVPTIVLYSFPSRNCGGNTHLNKRITAEEYKKWVIKISTAVVYYRMPINVIVEPGGLSEVLTNTEELCDERKKSDVLAERIDLIRYIAWNFELIDKHRNRINPNLRLFVDVGGPHSISNSKEMLATADALEKILGAAEIDGISTNIGENNTVEESLAWAKKLIGLVRLDTRKKLTVAVDIGHTNLEVLPTLHYPDPWAELVTVISVPGDGRGPTDSFDLKVLADYLRAVLEHTAEKK